MRYVDEHNIELYVALEREDLDYLKHNIADNSFEEINWLVRRCAEIGNLECLRVLLNACPTFNEDGKHAIIRAAHFKHLECVKELLKHPGTDATYCASAPLQEAMHNNDPACLAVLAPMSNFLMHGVYVLFSHTLQQGYMDCLQCMIDELHQPQRFAELAHCVLDAAQNSAFDVAERLAPNNADILQQILDTHDPVEQKKGAVWVADRLLKVRLDTMLDTSNSLKRKM